MLDENTKFKFFHFGQNSRSCLRGMAFKYKLSDVALLTLDSCQLTDFDGTRLLNYMKPWRITQNDRGEGKNK